MTIQPQRETPHDPTGLWSRENLWAMFEREHKERCRLLERNRKLEAKLIRRARVVGALRAANRKLLAQAMGTGNRVPE